VKTPVTFVDISEMRVDFCMKFYALFNNKIYTTKQHSSLLFICPMRQQHWTDYKISLCVCQSVSQWVSQSVNFGTPFISRERLKLETSNLANRLATGGTDEKCKIRSKGVVKGSRDLLKFGTPFISRERLKLEISNLAHRLATEGS